MRKNALIFGICFMFLTGLSFGQTWDFNKRLTYNAGFSFNIQSALDSGNGLHIVWEDSTPGNYEIFWKMGLSGGTGIWTTPKRLTYNSGNSNNPSICIDKDDNIHIAWVDDSSGNSEIYHKYSTDCGNTWSTPIRITWNSGNSIFPHISSSSDGKVHLFYSDGSFRDYEIYYKQFDISTKTWSAVKRLTYFPESARSPWGCVVQGNIHVVWQAFINGNYEIYHKFSSNNGSSWTAPTRITYNSGDSSYPKIIGFSPSGTTDSYLHLTWTDDSSGGSEIYYKKWSSVTGSWQVLKRMTWVPTEADSPTVAVDPNHNIHIIYSVKSPVDHDLFYKKSTDAGSTWSPTTRLTWNSSSGGCTQPYLIANLLNNDLLLVYCKKVNSVYECFLKRGSQGID